MRKIKIIFSFFLTVIFLLGNVSPVKADSAKEDSTGRILTAYLTEQAVCAYVTMPEDISISGVTAEVVGSNTNNFRYNIGKLALKPLEESGPLHFIFLIDDSDSMLGFSDKVQAYINGFLTTIQGNCDFQVLSFGTEMKTLCEETMNPETVIETVKSLKYQDHRTRLYTTIQEAVSIYGTEITKEGELFEVILFTDAIVYGESDTVRTEAASDLQQTVTMMVNSVIFGSETTESKVSVEQYRNTLIEANNYIAEFTSKDSIDAAIQGGRELAQDFNNLGFMMAESFYPIPEDSTDQILFTFSLGDEPLFQQRIEEVPRVSVVRLSNNEVTETPDVPTEAPDDSKEVPNVPTETPDTGKEVPETSTNTPVDGIVDFQDEESSWWKSEVFGINVLLIIGIICVFIIVFVILIFVVIKSRKVTPEEQSQNRVYMKLQVMSGCRPPKKLEYYLGNELLIGRGSQCHIVLKNKSISKVNSRIFTLNQMIYIEDLNSTNGTSISGMRLHAPNRLRSGDEITIGSVTFTLKF